MGFCFSGGAEKKYDKLKIKEAVVAVHIKEVVGLLNASQLFTVPRSTLKDYIKKPKP